MNNTSKGELNLNYSHVIFHSNVSKIYFTQHCLYFYFERKSIHYSKYFLPLFKFRVEILFNFTSLLLQQVAVWRRGNALVSINEVNLC